MIRFRVAALLAVVSGLSSAVSAQAGPTFLDRTEEIGVDFVHFNGMTGKMYFAEHMGGSVALVDGDGDGDLDIFLGQGAALDAVDPADSVLPPRSALHDHWYRNELVSGGQGGELRFVDASEDLGLEQATGYGMGVASGDYDRDGDLDLYVTQLGSNLLLRNDLATGGGWVDVTDAAGVDDTRWGVAASWFDYDGDGWLDLFVGNYVEFRVPLHKNCASPQGAFDYCGPLAYPAQGNRLLRNRGDGTFEDVTARVLPENQERTTLGSITADFDGDGRVDLYVANDMMPNELWLNQGDGTFLDDAELMGAAVDRNGLAQASMGVVAGDFDGNGAMDLFMTHLRRETNTLYLNDGTGMFEDATQSAGLGRDSLQFTGFGTAMLDADADGIDDLFVANGAVRRLDEQVQAKAKHPLKEHNQLFRGLGGGRFEVQPNEAWVDDDRLAVSRGAAAGDLDNDGDSDLVVQNNGETVQVLINQSDPERWLGIRLVEARSEKGPDLLAVGARARLRLGDQTLLWRQVRTDGSYGAASDPRLLWALDQVEGGDSASVEVIWPDGVKEMFGGIELSGYRTLRRGEGKAEAIASDDGAP